MTFSTDKVSEYLAYKKSFGFKFGLPRLSQLRRGNRMEVDKVERVNVNSRTVKMHTLMEIFAREQTVESLAEYMEEVRSMKEYDRIFEKFSKTFGG